MQRMHFGTFKGGERHCRSLGKWSNLRRDDHENKQTGLDKWEQRITIGIMLLCSFGHSSIYNTLESTTVGKYVMKITAQARQDEAQLRSETLEHLRALLQTDDNAKKKYFSGQEARDQWDADFWKKQE